MASPRSCRTRPATFLFVVTVILSLGATGALADLPATHLLLSELPLPPANDMFADATLITAFPYTDSVNNYRASVEGGESIFNDMTRTVWYKLTPGTTVVYQVDLYGSSAYNPMITVYRAWGSTLPDLQYINATQWNTPISWSAESGATYYIQIGNYNWSDGGDLTINVAQMLPPSNDNFADAEAITSLPFQADIDNTAATLEDGEPNYCGIGRTVWYKFKPTVTAQHRVEVLSSFVAPCLTLYEGTELSGLSYIGSVSYSSSQMFTGEAGVTYYLQLGNYSWDGSDGGPLTMNLVQISPPENDNFDGAMVIDLLPFSNAQNTEGATVEAGETFPSCAWNTPTRTVWYRYTPDADGSVMTQTWTSFTRVMAVYTVNDLGSLSEVACRFYDDQIAVAVQQGVTYYFQVANVYSQEFGDVNFGLDVTPPPTADFSWNPWDPSRYDDVQFCDQSHDPAGAGWSAFWWDFGDGATGSDYCTPHRYAADGDYLVWHKVQTPDGREAEVTKTVEVRTHDVAITKFAVPQSASAGQTRQITVGLRNYAYPEQVQVELYKSGLYGYEWIGAARQEVAVRSGNRTTDFKFSYTFTKDDASLGKVTFRAIATIQGPRDVLPADNEAISSPCKVSGKK